MSGCLPTYQDAGDGLSTDKARWDCRTSDEQKTAKQLHAYCQLGEGLIKLLICMTSAKKEATLGCSGVQRFVVLL